VLEYPTLALMSQYIADCDALAEIASSGQRTGERPASLYLGRVSRKLATLWNDENRHLSTKDLQHRHSLPGSPTNFYPMLAQAATPEQAKTMVEEAPDQTNNEFWGDMENHSFDVGTTPRFPIRNYWARQNLGTD